MTPGFFMRHIATRARRLALSALAVILASALVGLVYGVARQAKENVVASYKYYDVIIGPSGSETALALNTLFYTDSPLGTVEHGIYEKLKADRRVSSVVPFALGDGFSGFAVVGTSAEYMDAYSMSSGSVFGAPFEAVIGAAVAAKSGFGVGDTFFTTHGVSDTAHLHNAEAMEYTVTGVLSATGTAADNAVFTPIESVFSAHGLHEGGLTSVLVKTKSVNDFFSLRDEYSAMPGIQAINPAETLRGLIDNMDTAKNAAYILAGAVFVMNILVAAAVGMLNFASLQKEVRLMTDVGVSRGAIRRLIYSEDGAVTLISAGLGVGVCCVSMLLLRDYAASLGIALDPARLYAQQLLAALAVASASLLPLAASLERTLREGGE